MGKNKSTRKGTSELKKRKAFQLYQSKRFVEAEAAYLAISHADPLDAEVHHMVGLIYACMARFVEAEQRLERALQLLPNAPNTHYVLGGARVSMGKLDAAAESFSNALRFAPNMAEAYFELGNVFFAQERIGDAQRAYGRALHLKPSLAAAHFRLGLTYELQGNIDSAVACHKTAVGLDPNLVLSYCQLGGLMITRGHWDDALKYFHTAQRVQPGLVQAIAGEASICELRGDGRGAYDLIAPLLKQSGSYNPTVGLVYAKICRMVDRCAEAADYLESVLRLGSLPAFDRLKVHFGLGMLYDRMHRYDEAFVHFRQGNQLKSHVLRYDESEDLAYAGRLLKVFTAETMARVPRSQATEDRMIFIVGMPRSGTSLTEQILASHPEVYGAGELYGISDIVKLLSASTKYRGGYPESILDVTADQLDALAQKYLENVLRAGGDATRITDKMPHNFSHLGLINLLFPGARVVHCVRNPMDTCLSIYAQNFSNAHPYATDLKILGRYYRLYEKIMQHWKNVLDLQILDFHYEELVGNPEHQIRRLLDFCGLKWSDTCLNFHESKRDVVTASYDQVRQPLYSRSVGRWKWYEQHLQELKMALELPG